MKTKPYREKVNEFSKHYVIINTSYNDSFPRYNK